MGHIHLAYSRDAKVAETTSTEPRTRKPPRDFVAPAAFIMVPTNTNTSDTRQDVLDEWVIPALAKQFLASRTGTLNETGSSSKPHNGRGDDIVTAVSAPVTKNKVNNKRTTPPLVMEGSANGK